MYLSDANVACQVAEEIKPVPVVQVVADVSPAMSGAPMTLVVEPTVLTAGDTV